MAIAFVQAATQVNTAASSSTAPAITLNGVTAGNCLVAVGAIYDSDVDFTISSVTDGTNTYVVRSAVQTVGGDRTFAAIAYAVNVSAGNFTVAFNLSGTSAGSNRYFVLGLTEWSGVATSSPEDTFDANDDINISTNDVTAGPITTTDAGDLIIGVAAVLATDTTLNFASPASHDNRYRQNDANTYIGMDSSSWLPGATQTTYTLQWTHDNTAVNEGAGVYVALKPAGAPAGRTTRNTRSNPLGIASGMGFGISRSMFKRLGNLWLPDRRLVTGR